MVSQHKACDFLCAFGDRQSITKMCVVECFGQMSKQKQTDYFDMQYMATVISTQT